MSNFISNAAALHEELTASCAAEKAAHRAHRDNGDVEKSVELLMALQTARADQVGVIRKCEAIFEAARGFSLGDNFEFFDAWMRDGINVFAAPAAALDETFE